MQARTHDITQLLMNWWSGDQAALDLLMPLIRDELDRVARRQLGRERKGISTQLSPERIERVLAIDLALERLAASDERKSKVLEMRLFAGLTTEETAGALEIAPQTVMRDWKFASAWMRRELGGERVEERGALATD